MAAEHYILKVTAGPDYAAENQTPISPNTEVPFAISSSKIRAAVTVRVQNYRGLPASAPKTSPYFSADPHRSDLYSLSLDFALLEKDVNGNDLVFGNDFDHPIRDKLPPGFAQAMKIATWFIDPGLYGDPYCEEPYLYGPFLSSINTLRVGEVGGVPGEGESEEGKPVVVMEGADGEGKEERERKKVPGEAAARKKWFLTKKNLEAFTFEKGRRYRGDFFNPYLDFNDFALKLPGFSVVPGITIPIISYWDGQPLRYVLRNRQTDEVYLVVIFTLIPKDQVEKVVAEDEKAAKGEEGKTGGAAAAAAGDDDDADLD